MPLQATSGAASYDAFGGGVAAAAVPNYIEDVFSTWLYTGTGATQTITNGINLSGSGGLVWIKDRSLATRGHVFYDTARGGDRLLTSSGSNALTSTGASVSAVSSGITFNSNGFTLGTDSAYSVNNFFTTSQYASWSFREQPKFFDVVTYTGNGSTLTVPHNLGSAPGCMIIKRTNSTSDWFVYHRGLPTPYGADNPSYYATLNTSAAAAEEFLIWDLVAPTAANFTVAAGGTANACIGGATYVAYLFAHNAGGFGLSGTDNVISCGSYTGNGSATGPLIALGYEPQWLMVKNATSTGSWQIIDNMRGMPVGSADTSLQANSIAAEISVNYVNPTATGFQIVSTSGEVNTNASTYIYIAIRRGPMRVPTTGTSVLSVKTYSGTTTSAQVTHDVTFDMEMSANRDVSIAKFLIVDSLRGINGVALQTSSTTGDSNFPTYWSRKDQRTMFAPSAFDAWWAASTGTNSHASYGFVRAPSFFDEVCYTGTGAITTVTHNLAAVPQLMIVKITNTAQVWAVYSSSLASSNILELNTTASSFASATAFNSTAPTASLFTVGTSVLTNGAGNTYVAYLFANCPGVSNVGSYTGTGTTLTINCGFTAGSRFVLIKSTSVTGNWYVWDSARGIVAANDPYLLLNSTAAEVTTTDWVDTAATGFQLSNSVGNLVNTSGVTYIFLAIA